MICLKNCTSQICLVELTGNIFLFQVDMSALKQMGEHDLKELGIPMVLL